MFPDVTSAVEAYARGLRKSDSELIEKAFHPKAQIMGAPEGREHFDTREGFLQFIRRTPSPDSAGEPEKYSITILEETTTTAAVKFVIFYLGIEVEDLLLLARFATGWRIVGKVFHRMGPA